MPQSIDIIFERIAILTQMIIQDFAIEITSSMPEGFTREQIRDEIYKFWRYCEILLNCLTEEEIDELRKKYPNLINLAGSYPYCCPEWTSEGSYASISVIKAAEAEAGSITKFKYLKDGEGLNPYIWGEVSAHRLKDFLFYSGPFVDTDEYDFYPTPEPGEQNLEH